MPKVRGTRKEKALELLERIKNGPSFSNLNKEFNPEEAARQYKLWAESWICGAVVELVPELKAKRG